LFIDEETVWMDGPLTRAARHGAICYLDEVVEARQDTTVAIHSLTDHRRLLTLEKKSEVIGAHPDFMLVLSYNPGYQSILKELKASTRQRFVALDFDYPAEEDEVEIAVAETGLDRDRAALLVRLARRMRGLKEYGLEEGVSTRLVIYAARLAAGGLDLRLAVEAAMISPVTDDEDLKRAMFEVAREIVPPS
jgi:nitric oxide reductase NorQ protein